MTPVFASPSQGALRDQLFGAGKTPAVVAAVGGGGKTTLLRTLATELVSAGQSVVVTTTTKMRPPADGTLFAQTITAAAAILREGRLCWVGQPCSECKMTGLPGSIPELAALADHVLVEADGSRTLPLKMIDRAYEPVIPPEADAVVALAGLDALGRPLGEVVHRPALACAALGLDAAHLITPADVAALLRLCYAPKLVILNKADTEALRLAGTGIAALLPEAYCVVTSLRAWGCAARGDTSAP